MLNPSEELDMVGYREKLPCIIELIDAESHADRLSRYWDQLSADGLIERAFPDGSKKCAADLMDYIKSEDCCSFFVTYAGQDVGTISLDNFHGLTCHGHFNMIKGVRGYGVGLMKTAVEQLFLLKREEGYNFIDCIVGITPIDNRLACQFVERIGFKPISIWPAAGFSAKRNGWVDCLVTDLRREEIT
jgi:hypothetical protein